MKNAVLSLCMVALLASCGGASPKQETNKHENSTTTTDMNVKDKSFDELYKLVDPAEMKEILAGLMVEKDHTVITAGTVSHFNSMAASWEVLGRYFEKPTTLCLLGANRYTLEFIRKEQAYTMSFFPAQYTGDVIAFGSKSGRDSDKMQETKLTCVTTPSGNITYKEANVVIECQLFEITTVHPDDFYVEDGRAFVEKALEQASDYHKLVFGRITNVWIRK